MKNSLDEKYMKEALKEAKKAIDKGEVPVGAVVVREGVIISRAHNLKEKKNDSTAHAEMLAIMKAAKKIGGWRLEDCEIYVTLEPCPMCAGAIIQSRIKRLAIGTMDPKGGAVGSKLNLMDYDFNHKVLVDYGVMQEDCSDILKKFFRELRIRKEQP